MRYLKLYEGYYADSIKKIDQLKQEMNKVKEDYVSEVKNCIWDLIDDFGAVECEVEGEDEESYLVVNYEVGVKFNKLNDLLDCINECNVKCNSYLGRGISIEFISLIRADDLSTSLSNFSTKVRAEDNFNKKLDIIRGGIEYYFEPSDNLDRLTIEFIISI